MQSHPVPPLAGQWQVLSDGLQVQRVALYVTELSALAGGDAPHGRPLFEQAAPRALLARPMAATHAAADLVAAAGLSAWTGAPDRIGADPGPDDASPLDATTALVADALLDGVDDAAVRDAVAAVCAASGWWVGAFAAIRHTGVHHTTLEPVAGDVDLDVLHRAAAVVALGTAMRVLAQALRGGAEGEAIRAAYCRAVADAIVNEPSMPGLLEALGELRLVDLVGTSVPWRGQFTKYTGGTGAGQVE